MLVASWRDCWNRICGAVGGSEPFLEESRIQPVLLSEWVRVAARYGIIAMGFKGYGFSEQAAKVGRDISEAASYFVFHRVEAWRWATVYV